MSSFKYLTKFVVSCFLSIAGSRIYSAAVLQNLTEFLAPSTVSGSAITPSGARYLLGDLMTAANDNLGVSKLLVVHYNVRRI